MRNGIARILCLGSLLCLAIPEQAQEPDSHVPGHDGGVREVLESIAIPPVPHAPFTATLATEWIKYAADGGTVTLVNQRRIARDGQGRIYGERWWLVPKSGKVESTMNWIQLADPKQRTPTTVVPRSIFVICWSTT